jgi:hypothetical protein
VKKKKRKKKQNILVVQYVLLTGATNVMDLTLLGCRAARARATMQPMEWPTRWNDVRFIGSTTLLSIASTWSLSVYLQPAGFGLRPNPRRSTANSLQLEDNNSSSRNTVSAQKDDDDVNPWMKMASSASGRSGPVDEDGAVGSFRTKWSRPPLPFRRHSPHDAHPQSDHRALFSGAPPPCSPTRRTTRRPTSAVTASLQTLRRTYNVSETPSSSSSSSRLLWQ